MKRQTKEWVVVWSTAYKECVLQLFVNGEKIPHAIKRLKENDYNQVEERCRDLLDRKVHK